MTGTLVEERKRHISSYRATHRQSLWELSTTLVAFSTVLFSHGRISRLFFYCAAPPVLVRLFIIFHDAGHQSFAPSKAVNIWLWKILSILCMTPMQWQHDHHLHHSHFGNIDNTAGYQWHSTISMTRQQVEALRPAIVRLIFKFFRHPTVYFVTVPFYEWCIRFRIPVLAKQGTGFNTRDNMVNNIGILAYYYILYCWKGSALVVDISVASYFAGLFGYTLFHAQHAFEDGYAVKGDVWTFADAAFKGSSFIDAPWILHWTMMGIGYHHIHHYDPKVPGYLLRQCHEEGDPEFWIGVPVLDMGGREFWKSLAITMFDEDSGKFI